MNNKPNSTNRVAPPYRWQLTHWLRLFTGSLLAATLAGRLGNFFFLFELFSHFAVQYAVLALALTGYWLYAKPRWLAAIAVLVVLLNGLLIYPWFAAPKPSGTGPRDIRVLHANVLYANTDYTRIVRLVQSQSPDVFVLQEMTSASIRGVAALKPLFPYQYHIWSKGPCHILVGSRTPIRVDSSLARPERVISLKTSIRGNEMAMLTAHPQTPILPASFSDRNEQLAFISQKARRQRLPAVLVGDFNVSVFSPVYRRLFESPGLTACRLGFGLQPTWPRYLPFMFIPIDQAFVNNGFRTVNFQTLAQDGSDHKAVVVDLAFTNGRR